MERGPPHFRRRPSFHFHRARARGRRLWGTRRRRRRRRPQLLLFRFIHQMAQRRTYRTKGRSRASGRSDADGLEGGRNISSTIFNIYRGASVTPSRPRLRLQSSQSSTPFILTAKRILPWLMSRNGAVILDPFSFILCIVFCLWSVSLFYLVHKSK